eukprot:m51a1_g14203 hypothetical protein (216) ;mRNA; r:145309-146077
MGGALSRHRRNRPDRPPRRALVDRARAEVLARAFHPRLGAHSPLSLLPQDVLRELVVLARESAPALAMDDNDVVYMFGEWTLSHDATSTYLRRVDNTLMLRLYDETNGWFEVWTSAGSTTVWSDTNDEFKELTTDGGIKYKIQFRSRTDVVEVGPGSVRTSSKFFTVNVMEEIVRIEIKADDEVIDLDLNGTHVTFVGDRTRRSGSKRGIISIVK